MRHFNALVLPLSARQTKAWWCPTIQAILHYSMVTRIALLIAILGTLALGSPADVMAQSESRYHGWDYLAARLIEHGVAESQVRALLTDRRFPVFENIPFAADPQESHALYAGFTTKKNIHKGHLFLERHREVFDRTVKRFGVPRAVITALLIIETGLGENTGDALVAYRLARLVGLADPDNVTWNYHRLKKLGENVTEKQIAQRAKLLENTFLHELPVLISLAQRGAFDLFTLRGSQAGAFGLPQFLPSSYIKYGCDGDGDKKVSLFNPADAICSVANYLHMNGWRGKLSVADKKAILFTYNKSEPYGAAVLKLAGSL